MPCVRAVLFDLCDTLVHFDAERLPLVEVDQQPTRSTARVIYDAMAPSPSIAFAPFFTCLKTVTAEIASQRDVDHREITSRERFRRVLERLGLPAESDHAQRLVDAHMTRLAHALVTPPHHRAVVADLARRVRLGIVSNFDHAPTVRAVLKRDRLEEFFDVVIVSDEIGWRKPHQVMFETALQQLGVPSGEALFVGDNYELDVQGATKAGLAAAWYTGGRTVTRETRHPILVDLAEIDRLL
ncbi:MAG: HAD family hydrolase [Nitrospirota bacterium]